MKVLSFFKDISALKKAKSKRKERIINASPKPLRHDPVKALARALHPEKSVLVISSVTEISDNSKVIRFVNKNHENAGFPIFQSGQYLNVKINMDTTSLNRPFFISSAPFEALPKEKNFNKSHPFIEITVQKLKNGITNQYIWNNWKVGTEVEATFPHGKFFYEPLRDSSHLIALAEGAGISPFCSMIKEIIKNEVEYDLTVVYKKRNMNNSKLLEDLQKLINKDSSKINLIALDDEDSFVNSLKAIGVGSLKDYTFFICTNQAVYEELYGELKSLGIAKRRIRSQIYDTSIDMDKEVNFPSESKGKNFNVTIIQQGKEITFQALWNETLMTSLEKAGVKKDSHCHSGECGYCRARLIKGNVFVNPLLDTRRIIDSEFGYFHPCVSYPTSDLILDLMN